MQDLIRETYIPPPLTSSLQYYPNPFISIQQQQQHHLEKDKNNNNNEILWWTNEKERQQLFHPVIILPKNKNHYILSDYSSTSKRATGNDNTHNLANDIERTNIRTMNIVQKFIRHLQLGTIPKLYYWLSTIQNQCEQVLLFFRKSNNAKQNFDKVHYLKRNQNQLQENNDNDDDDENDNDNDNANNVFDEQSSLIEGGTTSKDTNAKTVSRSNGSPRKTNKATKIKTKTIVCYYGIGKYDENRVSLYKSELFDNVTNSINGYSGQRTVHVGIDMNGPLGTVVYSVADGVLYAAGYNPALGDYGYVIVVHHTIQLNNKVLVPVVSFNINNTTTTTTTKNKTCSCTSNDSTTTTKTRSISFYALYGHLDEYTTRSIRNQYKKQQQQERNLTGKSSTCSSITKSTTGSIHIKKGQIIGRLGDIDENGGWKIPHVHFQLSINEPDPSSSSSELKHDLPGAITYNDRNIAHWDYPDPRHILGELY